MCLPNLIKCLEEATSVNDGSDAVYVNLCQELMSDTEYS